MVTQNAPANLNNVFKKALENQKEWGFEFLLYATSRGLDEVLKIKRCHMASTIDTAAINALPSHARDSIYTGIDSMRNLRKRRERDKVEADDFRTLDEYLERQDEFLPIADTYVIALSIDPPVVPHERDLAAVPDGVVVTNIHPEDRLAFYAGCQDASSPQAKRFIPFRPPADSIEARGVVTNMEARSTDAATRTIEQPGRPTDIGLPSISPDGVRG